MEKGRILRLRGLPWSAGEEDVRSFFDGFEPADVYVRRRGGVLLSFFVTRAMKTHPLGL